MIVVKDPAQQRIFDFTQKVAGYSIATGVLWPLQQWYQDRRWKVGGSILYIP